LIWALYLYLGLSYLFTSSVFLTFPGFIDAGALNCRMHRVVCRADLIIKHAEIVTRLFLCTSLAIARFDVPQILAALHMVSKFSLVGRKPNWVFVFGTLEAAIKVSCILFKTRDKRIVRFIH